MQAPAATGHSVAPSSPPRRSSTSYAMSETSETDSSLALEEVAVLITRGGAKEAALKETKPKLTVSASGRFQNQFFHTQEGSRAAGIFKNRAMMKQQHGDDHQGDVKMKQRLSLNGRDAEQFSVADILFSGYLVKQGSFWKTWRRRYFILRRDVNVLAYYKSQENLVKLGEITIDGHTKVSPPSPSETAFPGKFTVEHEGRKLVLVAEDGFQSAETWTMVIQRCVTKRAVEAEAAAVPRTSHGSMRSSMPSELSGNGSELEKSRRVSETCLQPMAEDSLPPRNLSGDAVEHKTLKQEVEDVAMVSLPQVCLLNLKGKCHSTDSQTSADESSKNRDSALSTLSASCDDAHVLHDECGFLISRTPTSGIDPSSKNFRSSLAGEGGRADTSSTSDTRARNLSLPTVRPMPSIELSVSIGCRGVQDVSHMLVVLTSINLDNRGNSKELGRTEVQGALSLRACGGDFFARDFSALLPVPTNGGRNLMLQFEVFSMLSLSTEVLSSQQSLGLVRIPHVDLLFSGESTLVLECQRSKLAPSKQNYFVVIDRIRPSETLNLGHTYTYAKRHFIADIESFDMRTETSADLFARSSSPRDKPASGSGPSFEVADPPLGSAGKEYPSSQAYGGMVRGDGDSSDATQVFISEELSASYCSISVAAKYMGVVQQRNQQRIYDALLFVSDIEKKYEKTPLSSNSLKIPSSSNSPTWEDDLVNLHRVMILDAEYRMKHYKELYSSYDECEEYYEKLLAMLESGMEPGITGCLKRCTHEKDKLSQFMPTNLNSHVVRARRVALSNPPATEKAQESREKPTAANGDELVYAIITHGCPAASCLGFKEGGLRRLQQLSQAKDDLRLFDLIEQRQDIVRCQILAIASAAFLSVIGLAANQSACHQEHLELMCHTGFLLSMESLLNATKDERGMIEDMYEGVQWLNSSVRFQVEESTEQKPKLKCAKCVTIIDSDNGDNVVAIFALPRDVFATLPDVLRQGQAVKVHSVMFTQGISEKQPVTNYADDINIESANRLVRYFEDYKTHVMAMQPSSPQRVKDLPNLEIQIKIFAENLYQSRKTRAPRKNVSTLIESSELCRRLGASRTTCCSNGKDRTAMSVTLELSRLLTDKFRVKQGVHLCNAMRERGVRRVNVLANTGTNKYALRLLILRRTQRTEFRPIRTRRVRECLCGPEKQPHIHSVYRPRRY